MNKPSLPICLLFLCLVALPLSMAQIPDYKPLVKLDQNKIKNIIWYQLFWADNVEWNTTACCIFWFPPLCPNSRPNTIWFQNAYTDLTPTGTLHASGSPGKFNPEVQGEIIFGVWNDAIQAEYVIEHADDYSWLIMADTEVAGGKIYVLTNSLTNKFNDYLTSRGLELASQYNLANVHWLEHGKQCNYDKMMKGMKALSQE